MATLILNGEKKSVIIVSSDSHNKNIADLVLNYSNVHDFEMQIELRFDISEKNSNEDGE